MSDTPATGPIPSKPLAHVYDAAYASTPNWDIGRPQRAFVYLAESGLIEGPVLDVGCGTGELSLFLARYGHDVLGVDLSPRAIEQAKSKARWRRIDAHFLVLNALDLHRLADAGFSFPTVVDSAMFHIFGDQERERFIDGLETVVPSGGLYCVLGDARPRENDIYGLTPDELQNRFEGRGDWTIEFAYDTSFDRRHSSNPAYLIGARRR